MTLNVVLADKNVDVGLLRVIGLHRKRLVQIFLGQGFFIAFMGSLAGFFLGSLLVLNLDFIIRSFELMVNNLIYLGNFSGITAFPSYYRYEIMPQEVFYLTSLPYKLVLRDYLIQGIGTFILAMLASFSPALKVLKNNPAEILRNE
jgi:lipoprotein-releasing system permease protein